MGSSEYVEHGTLPDVPFIENAVLLKGEDPSPLLRRRSFWKKYKRIFRQHRSGEKDTERCTLG
jgi:hypothetical protein